MFVIKVNVDPKIIGHGELACVVSDAIRNHIIQQAQPDPRTPLVSVGYEADS